MTEIKSYTFETHQGPHLNLNEDLIDVDLGLQLFMIADGFGGSNVGDRAATQSKEYVKKFFGKISQDPDSTLPFYFSSKYLLETNALINAFRGAHEQVFKENLQRSITNRGGASVMALALSENMASIVSTGNCLGLLMREQVLSPFILPDTYLTAPMSGIGLFEDFHYQSAELKLLPGDLLLFLTDGVYASCGISDIQELLLQKTDNHKRVITDIFKIANDRGNLDNQSAIFLQF